MSFDVNHRTALWSDATASTEVREVVQRADVVLATEDEARLVVDAPDAAGLARRLADCGAAHVLIKQGADGALALIDGVQHTVPAVPVAAVDPVGAGDAFGAAYLTVLCRDGSADERLRTAAAAGAFAVTVPGDWEGLPSAAELDLLGLAPGSVVR